MPEDPTAEVEVANRFSGQKTTMPEFAAAVYDVIIGSEMLQDYKTVRQGLDWFKQHFAKHNLSIYLLSKPLRSLLTSSDCSHL